MRDRREAVGHPRLGRFPGRWPEDLVRDRQIHHAERELGYRVYLVGYGGGREREKGRKGRKAGKKGERQKLPLQKKGEGGERGSSYLFRRGTERESRLERR